MTDLTRGARISTLTAESLPQSPTAPAEVRAAPRRDPADILAIGVGTTVAMWTIGYFVRLAGDAVPPIALFIAMAAMLILGGYIAARFAGRSLKGAAAVGVTVALLNLLILGSLISKKTPNLIDLRLLAVGLPGWFAAALGLTWLGAALGRGGRGTPQRDHDWPAIFAHVLVAAVLVLLLVGGVVTSADAGLAVVDWPNSYGYNMFLYPLSKMTGGIYFEHSHRLFGSLVGLITLLLALYLQRYESRGAIKVLGWIAFAAVCVQGVMGGLRVTGKPTLSMSPADTAPNLLLAVVHGTFAQLFFGFLVALASLISRRWRDSATAASESLRSAVAQHKETLLPAVFVATLLIQLLLGVFLRHLGGSPLPHMTMAAVVAIAGLGTGFRNWAFAADPFVQKLGSAVMAFVLLQLMLGIAAFIFATPGHANEATSAPAVIFPTAHQTTGAALLGLAAANYLWTVRAADQTAAPAT